MSAQEAIDTSGTIEIERSVWRLLGFFLLAVGLVAVCVFLILPGGGGLPPNGLAYLVCLIGVAFFGLMGVLAVTRMFATEPVVILSPAGFRDTRIAPETIPWSAIHRIGTWTMNRQSVMTLDIDPEFERTLSLSRIVRWSRGANAKLGVEGLATNAAGIKCGFDRLMALTTAYAMDHHDPAEGSD